MIGQTGTVEPYAEERPEDGPDAHAAPTSAEPGLGPLAISVGTLQIERATFIEPRRTAKEDDHVFFTHSPLRSDQHLAMLEALCAMG